MAALTLYRGTVECHDILLNVRGGYLNWGFEQVLFWHHRVTWLKTPCTSPSETQISSLAYGYRFAALLFVVHALL